jgi:hypothetical protein
MTNPGHNPSLLTRLTLLTLTTLAPAAHAAAPASTTHAVALTLTTPDEPAVELLLTLSDTHGCASASEKRRDRQYDVTVCRDGGDDIAPILSFDVERVLHREQGSEQRRLRVKARVALGKPVRVARYGEGKSALDATATVTRVDAAS